MSRRRRYSLFTRRYVTRALTGGLLRLHLDKKRQPGTIAFGHSPISFQLIAFNHTVSIASRKFRSVIGYLLGESKLFFTLLVQVFRVSSTSKTEWRHHTGGGWRNWRRRSAKIFLNLLEAFSNFFLFSRIKDFLKVRLEIDSTFLFIGD